MLVHLLVFSPPSLVNLHGPSKSWYSSGMTLIFALPPRAFIHATCFWHSEANVMSSFSP
jgi:hypothetical protein